MLQASGLKVGAGAIVDATIIAAPSSTKNDDGTRELEMLQTRKSQQWHGGRAYASQQTLIASKAPNARDMTNQRVRADGASEDIARLVNHAKSRVRSRVEHVFAAVKRLWGFNKLRYRGLAKNATRAFVALGLANIFMARRFLNG